MSSFGEDKEKTITNLKDAIQLMLEPISEPLLNMKPPADAI